jgi:CheY-like chemotaxis protein
VKWILLADDSADDAEFIRMALKTAGVGNPIVVVNDGDEAIDYLRGKGAFANREKFPLPKVLLLDLVMPRIDGFEVLEWIRSQADLKQMLLIVLSGHQGLREVNRAYALGANSFLFKPADPAEIRNLVESFSEYWSPVLPESPDVISAAVAAVAARASQKRS